LLPRAAVARGVLPDGLGEKGWTVDVVEAYRADTVVPDHRLLEAARAADAITFTSSSTVTNYLAAAGADTVPPLVACIGPITAANRFAAFGPGSCITAPQVALVNPWAMSVGANVYIRSYFILEAYAAAGSVVVRIDDGVQLGHYVRVVAFNGIVMEELVGIGHG